MLFKKPVEVEPRSGEGAYGPVFGPAKVVRGRLTFKRRVVKTSEGDDLMAEATLLTSPDPADDIPVQSRVRVDDTVYTAAQSFKPEALSGEPTHQEVLLVP